MDASSRVGRDASSNGREVTLAGFIEEAGEEISYRQDKRV
jgi:hypothetical protein